METKPHKCLKCEKSFSGNGFRLCKKCRKENEGIWDLEGRYVSHVGEVIKLRESRRWIEMGWSVHRTPL